MVSHSQMIAKGRGLDGLERTGSKSFGTHPDMYLSLQAANIKRHFFADTDIVYVLKSADGRIIGQGNAEFLNALYRGPLRSLRLSSLLEPKRPLGNFALALSVSGTDPPSIFLSIRD
jgi:hypothetical protein